MRPLLTASLPKWSAWQRPRATSLLTSIDLRVFRSASPPFCSPCWSTGRRRYPASAGVVCLGLAAPVLAFEPTNPECIAPAGPGGGWDRGDDGIWRMFYTAVNSRGLGVKSQKIGMAESDDDTTLFRRLMGGVRRLKQDRVTPRTSRHRPRVRP